MRFTSRRVESKAGIRKKAKDIKKGGKEMEMEKCLACREEISEETIKKNDGRFCDNCTEKGKEIEKKAGMI